MASLTITAPNSEPPNSEFWQRSSAAAVASTATIYKDTRKTDEKEPTGHVLPSIDTILPGARAGGYISPAQSRKQSDLSSSMPLFPVLHWNFGSNVTSSGKLSHTILFPPQQPPQSARQVSTRPLINTMPRRPPYLDGDVSKRILVSRFSTG